MKNIILRLTVGPLRFIVRRLGKRYEVRYKFNKKHLVADLLLFFGVIGLIIANFYIFIVFTQWTISLQVKLNLNLPTEIHNGEPFDVTVDYGNLARKGSLADAKLTLQLPKYFVVSNVSDGRYDAKTGSLLIGDLLPRAEGQLKLTGELWDNVGTKPNFTAKLDYIQQAAVDERLTWQDDKTAKQDVPLTGSVINCMPTLPAAAVNNVAFNFSVVCQNNSTASLDNLVVKLPQATKTVWQIGKLATGQSSSFSSQAKLAAGGSQTADFGLTLSGRYGQRDLALQDDKYPVKIIAPKISWSLLTNTLEKYAPLPNEELYYVLHYQNNDTVDFTNAAVGVQLSEAFSDSSFKSDSKFKFLDNGVVYFDSIGDLSAGQSGEVAFMIKVKDVIGPNDNQLTLTPWLKYQVSLNDQTTTLEVPGASIIQTLSSKLTLDAFGRFYSTEGEQLGVGPLPPVVGVPTKFRVFWRVSNLPNAVDDVIVVGKLPNNVSWTGEESVNSGNSLDFNSKTRELTWAVGHLEPLTGVNSLPALASFSLELTPLAAQVGQNAVLLQNIVIKGRDAVTGRQLEATAGNITTELSGDKSAVGKSVVIKL